MSQLTLEGEALKVSPYNPDKDLSPVELKIYNYLFRLGPKTEIEIRRNPTFDDIADIGRALRRMRSREKKYVDSIPGDRGKPQKWMVVRWPSRRGN